MKLNQLETARLRIREFNEGDLEHCLRFRREVFGLDDCRDKAQNWLTWTIDSYRELAGLGQPPYADYAIEKRDSGAFIGAVGIVPTVVPWGALKGDAKDLLLSPEIGLFWGIMPGQRRRRFATEAAGALLDYLFEDLRARQVVATTERNNLASRRTIERLGMRLYENPNPEPQWRQVVGLALNPGSK